MTSAAGPSRFTYHPHRPDAEEDALSIMAAQLSLMDIEEIENQEKGKQRQGTPMTDAQLALRIFAEEQRASIVFDSDRAIAQSLHNDYMRENGPRGAPVHVDATPRRDQTAQRASLAMTRAANPETQVLRTTAPPRVSRPSTSSWSLSSWIVSAVATLFGADIGSLQPGAPNISRPTRLTGHNCVICQDPIRGVEIRAPCGHFYDKACVTDLFTAATRDESLYPPRCCRSAIPFADVRPHLPAATVTLFAEKSREFGTLKRVYCANPTCSQFLGPQYTGWFPTYVICPAAGCSTRTCNACKTKVGALGFHTCNISDDADKDVLALGKSSGWAQCPGCSQMIELNMGCYHMTCLCKTQFCYLCKSPWKTCRCPQWDERRLLVAAEQRVDMQLGAVRRPPLPPRQATTLAQRVPRVPDVPVQQINRGGETRNIVRPNSLTLNQRESAQRNTIRSTASTGRSPSYSTLVRSPSLQVATPDFKVNQKSQAQRNPTRPSSVAALPPAPPSTITPNVHRDTRGSSSRTSPAVVQSRYSSQSDQTRFSGTVADPQRARLIREAVEDLRVNHDCQHTKWRYRQGGGRCETCYHHLPLYLFRCGGCQILSCNRCRRNRL